MPDADVAFPNHFVPRVLVREIEGCSLRQAEESVSRTGIRAGIVPHGDMHDAGSVGAIDGIDEIGQQARAHVAVARRAGVGIVTAAAMRHNDVHP